MEMFKINGRNVYTHSLNRVTENELLKSMKKTGKIVDAYFFQLERDAESEFRVPKSVNYESSKIETHESGLMLDIESEIGCKASTSIAGLEAIASLLNEAQIIDFDVSKLKGRKVTEYGSAMILYGIALDEQ